MPKIMNQKFHINTLYKSKNGQAFTEYILIIGLVALTCIAGVRIFSKVINKYYSNVVTVYTVFIP